jgi:hypothetical protein
MYTGRQMIAKTQLTLWTEKGLPMQLASEMQIQPATGSHLKMYICKFNIQLILF